LFNTLKKTRFSPYLALTLGILMLSMTGILVRWADAPGTVTAAYRMGIAALVLTPLALREKRNSAPVQKRGWILLILAGIFAALDHGTLNTSIGFTRIANATLLNNLSPLWVALFVLLVWRESLNRWFWLGLLLALAGAAVILGVDLINHPQLGTGDFLAFLSSFFYAGYFLVTQVARRSGSLWRFSWSIYIVSALLLLAFNLIMGIPFFDYPLKTFFVFIAIGVFCQSIGITSIVYALGHLPASIVSPTMVAQIVLTSLLAIPLTGERLSVFQALGGVIVIAGIILVNISRSRHIKTLPTPDMSIPPKVDLSS
jgi:drug/metabolite transporter (DMT)-like permease